MSNPCSTRSRTQRRALAILAAVALAVSLGALAGTTAAAAPMATTSAQEAQRVDAVPTPQLVWHRCPGMPAELRCAEVQLPLDYDDPDGKTITIALAKRTARDPGRRVGSLFLNPGGPGGSARSLVAQGNQFLSSDLLDRFDIIGMDPRGVGGSTTFSCFENVSQGMAVLQTAGEIGFPTNPEEQRRFLDSSRALSQACSTHGREMASAMSTAQVARDMEVLRRAVGDDQLNYLGFSYGSYLGQVYAAMFPDRIRALAIDGVLNATEWLGGLSPAPFEERVESAAGADYAMETLLDLCARAEDCVLEDPHATTQAVLQRLRTEPVEFPRADGDVEQITYARFTQLLRNALTSAQQVEAVVELIHLVSVLDDPEGLTQAQQVRFGYQFLAAEQRVEEAVEDSPIETPTPAAPESDSSTTDPISRLLVSHQSHFFSVICSEGSHPGERYFARRASSYSQAHPYFGAAWYWVHAPCATGWKARDEDAYRGPFNKHTSAPILVVGNEFDPSTNVWNAAEVARILPNSRLVLANSWGHLAYPSSACAKQAIDNYLISPEGGDRIDCRDGVQPFE